MTETDSSHGKVDVVTLEVIRNALPAIADEMSYVLYRTSYNMMIYEVRDYCTALLDREGRLLSQNVGGVSHFVADLGVVVRDGIARFGVEGLSPGDVIMTNHQAVAGQHLNNIVVYSPIFHAEELLGFAVVRAHWVDVGGYSTGFGGAGAFDPWSEGLQLDQVRIHEGGIPDAKVLKLIADNIRYPDASMGDLRSQIAACNLGRDRFLEVVQRYGRDTLMRLIDVVYGETERRCRAVVAGIPDGTYEAESTVDVDGGAAPPLKVKVVVTVRESDMEIDFSGCSAQRPDGAMNARTYAGAYIAYKALTAPFDPVNEGSFAGLRTVIPEGNMMMASFPALMSDWSSALPTVVDTVWKALSGALPDQIPGGHSGRLGPEIVFFGNDPSSGRSFLAQGLEGGGWGGRPRADGESASVSVCQGDVRNAPIESLELKNPLLVEERALREDSGGVGEYRGGFGIRLTLRALAEGRWYVDSGIRLSCPPWGLAGGGDGAIGGTWVAEDGETFEYVDRPAFRQLPANAVVRIESAGGGGWGDPLERDPARVEADVADGVVSVDRVLNAWGVVLGEDGAVDLAKTERERARRRSHES